VKKNGETLEHDKHSATLIDPKVRSSSVGFIRRNDVDLWLCRKSPGSSCYGSC